MEMIKTIRETGVVGAGGAGFPTHAKVRSDLEIVIANGAECEPLLSNDKYILAKHGEEVVQGLELILEVSGARKGIIAIKKKNADVISSIEKIIKSRKDLSLALLDDFYPAGDELILVSLVTGKNVPQGELPLSVGCMVSNVETLRNIYRASLGEPVTRRTLTCAGEVKNPSVVITHIGTSIQDVIDACGGSTVETPAIIVGGPMMGNIERDLNAPVTKTMTGIIVLPSNHILLQKKSMSMPWVIKQSKVACCQCTYCTELCPRYLLGHELYPHKIMRSINFGLSVPPEIIESAFLCSECGLCEVYACPMELSPRMVNHAIKNNLLESNYHPQFDNKKVITRGDDLRNRKIPTSRIKNRLQIGKYDRKVSSIVETNPSKVEILLKQHIGLPAVPVVKMGDKVTEGDLLADIPEGKLGARVHASIKGRVSFVDQERIIIKRES
ncbi:MAG: hypothetical protein PWP04_1649 [Candidatus Atribacteria bacterium]|nr:hypothetical protein [Candidatus Atribacteria bacterium]